MGIPEMRDFWNELVDKKQKGILNKSETELYSKWGKAMAKLMNDPFYPSLETHEIPPLTKRYGLKVWQSYLENNKSKARRMYWIYGPEKKRNYNNSPRTPPRRQKEWSLQQNNPIPPQQ